MAKALRDFSIETDDQVTLIFSDGTKQTVSVKRLKSLLRPQDLKRVEASLRLRRSFLDTHWPKTGGLALVGAAALGVMVSGGHVADQLPGQKAAPPAVREESSAARKIHQASPPTLPVSAGDLSAQEKAKAHTTSKGNRDRLPRSSHRQGAVRLPFTGPGMKPVWNGTLRLASPREMPPHGKKAGE